MKLPKLSLSKKESILISITLIGVTFLLHRYWIIPNTQTLNALQEQVSATQKQIQNNKTMIAELSNRAPASEELKTSFELYDKYIKLNNKFSSIVSGIVNSSKNDSLLLNKISALGQSSVTGYTKTLYSVEIEAAFIAIGKFLENLEDSPLLTEVDSIDITRIPSEMSRCKAHINLFSYVSGDRKIASTPKAVAEKTGEKK